MRRLLLVTLAIGALFLILGGSALQTLRLGNQAALGASSSDLLDSGTLAILNLRQVSVGGSVIKVLAHGVLVQDKHRRLIRVTFPPRARFFERGALVSQAAVEVRSHLTMLALPSGAGYAAYKVLISPYRVAIGGTILSNQGLLTIAGRRGKGGKGAQIWAVRLLKGAQLTVDGQPLRTPLRDHMTVVALAYPDPAIPGVYLADKLRLVKPPTSQRVGGIITRIDRAANLIALRSSGHQVLVEVQPGLTKITLNVFPSGYDDMQLGDHITVVGPPDPARGPTTVRAKIIRISSPSFGGVITAIAPAPVNAVTLTVRGHHGHVLRIDAPGQTRVYTKVGSQEQTARVLDLQLGEHISVHGKRVGKFELLADAVHVYPHQRTIGGMVASILPGRIRIVAGDGTQYIVHITPKTGYSLNGKPSLLAAVKVKMHIRARGYDALRSDQPRIVTIIASHVSIIIHVPHKAKPKVKVKGAVPTPTPAPHAVVPATVALPAAVDPSTSTAPPHRGVMAGTA